MCGALFRFRLLSVYSMFQDCNARRHSKFSLQILSSCSVNSMGACSTNRSVMDVELKRTEIDPARPAHSAVAECLFLVRCNELWRERGARHSQISKQYLLQHKIQLDKKVHKKEAKFKSLLRSTRQQYSHTSNVNHERRNMTHGTQNFLLNTTTWYKTGS